MAAAAPQVVNRLIRDLADNVPAGDLDGGDGAHMDLGALGVHVADQTLRNDFDLKRVHAEDQRFQLVDGGLHGLAEIIQRAFTNSMDAVAGSDLREQPVLPGIPRDVSFD